MSVGANAASASAYYSSFPQYGSAPGVASFSGNAPGANTSAGAGPAASNNSLPNAPGPNADVVVRAAGSAAPVLHARSLNSVNGQSTGIAYSVDSIGTPREFKPEYKSLLKAETIGPAPIVHKPENTSRKVVEAQNSGMLALILGCGVVGVGTFAGIPILWEALGKTQRTQFKSMMEKVKDKAGDHLDGKHLNEADDRLVKLAREIFQEDVGKELRAFYKTAHSKGSGLHAETAAYDTAEASDDADASAKRAEQSRGAQKWGRVRLPQTRSPLSEISDKLNDAAREDGHDLQHGIVAEAEGEIFQARAVVMHAVHELALKSDDGDLKAFVAQQHDNFFGTHPPQGHADLRDPLKLNGWHSDWLQCELGIERERHTRFVDAVIDPIIQRTARPARRPYLAELR